MTGIETVAILGMVAAATAVVSTAAAVQSSRTQRVQAEYQSKIADNNRLMATRQAREQELRIRQRNRILIGIQRGAVAETGLFGQSAFNLIEESIINTELDALMVRAGGIQQSQNFNNEKAMLGLQSQASGQNARNALIGGGLQVAGAYAGYKANIGGLGADKPWTNPDTGKVM